MGQTAHAIVNKEGDIVYNAITVTPYTKSMSCHGAWDRFFKANAHQFPIGDAIKAYEAIGYRCVQFKLTEVV